MTHEAGHVVITFFCRQICYVAFTRIDGLVLTRTLTQTFMIWSPFLLPKVPFWSPSHSKLGPLLVPILKNLGPLSMWEQWVSINATWHQRFWCNTHEMYRLRFMRYDIGLAVKKARLVRQLRCTWQGVAWHESCRMM